uniref:RNase NYN domain-containing protein n=1 Tax=Megaviridae environmental sample TaxID=1737588 RepID=A0A5J6VKX6_9VIRU|nr:MAG: hypothetical protein [Megaviridae environmental sample]
MSILREFSQNLDTMTLKEFTGIKTQFENSKSSEKHIRSFNTLVLRYHIINNNIYEVNKFINSHKNLMKRDYLEYIKYIYTINNDEAIQIFKLIINKFTILDSDIKFIVINGIHNLIKFMSGFYLKYDMNASSVKDLTMLKYYNPINDKSRILKLVESKLQKNSASDLKKKLTNVDIVIDGGNIAHYDGGKLNYKYFYNIIKLVCEKFENPLLIIHKRHTKNTTVMNTIKTFKINFYETSYGINDDYYIIYSIIFNNCYVLTLDNYKDHIHFIEKSCNDINNKIRNYIDEKIIKYSNKHIDEIPEYSACIQYIDNVIYVPTRSGFIKFD